jgi:hypothetical protein
MTRISKSRFGLATLASLYRKGVLDRDAKNPREEFKRVRKQPAGARPNWHSG